MTATEKATTAIFRILHFLLKRQWVSKQCGRAHSPGSRNVFNAGKASSACNSIDDIDIAGVQSIPTHKEDGDNDDDADNGAELQAAIIVTNAARRIRLMSSHGERAANEFRVAMLS